MANKILIPIDFSPNADKAVEYAIQLNKIVPHEIDLVHIFTDHSNIYRNALENPELIDPRVGEAKKNMQILVDKLKSESSQLSIQTIFKDGNLYDQLKSLTEQNNYEAIIMGTKGASGLDALLIGSNMFDVFQNTHLPVLAVPYAEKTYKTDKIGLLCNFKDGEIEVLKQAINIYGVNFELVLVHVNTTNETIQVLDKKFESFIERIIDETGIENISYIIKSQSFLIQYKEDISQAIDSVILDELLDALLITKSKKGFLRKIIEEDIVKKMAYQIQIPKFFAKR